MRAVTWGLMIVVAILCLWTQRVRAAEFVYIPSSPQIPTDRNQLVLIGEIVPGDYDRFVSAIRSHGTDFLALHLRSGGGNVQEAIRIGRLVRQLLIFTYAAPPQELQGMTPESINKCSYDARFVRHPVPCICASACTLIFLSGVFRVGWEMYVHSIAYDKKYYGSLPPQEAAIKYRQGMEEVKSYLAEIGVDNKWYDRMLGTSSAQLDKVTLNQAPELFGWEPAMREWLLAKCGTKQAVDMNTGSCWSDPIEKARVEAVKKFLAQN